MAKQPTKPPIAIVGMSALFPGSSELEGYWSDILRGKDMIREVPENYWLVDDYYEFWAGLDKDPEDGKKEKGGGK